MQFSIRTMEDRDFETVRALSDELGETGLTYDSQIRRNWAHTTSGERYFQGLLKGKGICYIAESQGEIIGIITASFIKKNDWRLVKLVEVDNLFIREHYRNHGIGKQLLEAVVLWAQQKKADRVMISAFAKNTEALRFYSRQGFVPYETVLEKHLI